MESVYLPPVSASLYDQSNLEPQYVIVRSNNRSSINILASDAKLEGDRTNILISSVKTSRDQPTTLARGFRRISISNFDMVWVTPNINERNNTLRFWSVGNSAFFTVTLEEGFYISATDVLNEIIAKLNAAGSSVTFAYVVVPKSGGTRFKIQSLTSPFYFDKNCDAVVRGAHMYGFEVEPAIPVPGTSKNLGPVLFCYTRFIDICSSKLNAYNKLPDGTTGYSNNIVSRIYLRPDQLVEPNLITGEVAFDTSKNFLYDDSLSLIDIQLRDEFGDLLYVPDYVQNFDWGMRLLIES